jgi:protein-L-isoaspartate(D-aspartate) O-methyltransferase
MYNLQRKNMAARLASKGIIDERVLAAMEKIPRHLFVAKGLEHQAYDEKALPIGFGQTISHPYTVALMTQSIQVKYGQKILEIGTGSGYQAAVLCELGAQVFTIERIAEIGKKAAELLKEMNYHFVARIGNGALGWQTYAPYDSIIVTAGAPVLPENLLNQLALNGKMIIPVGGREGQILTLYEKLEDGYRKTEIENLKFVPFIGV